ncbi:MAG: hypothetical protein IIW95_01365, partial [Lachnospiraceae bacterium]|nr:hypothetical protein [Lachnospiraceae bacterium]
VFQLESVGMNNAIAILKPNCFEDIVNLLALYRPGPMDQIEDFAMRKNSSKQFSSRDKELEDILKSTYGKIIYQEQIMQIASRIAGFSANDADLFMFAKPWRAEKSCFTHNYIRTIAKGSKSVEDSEPFSYPTSFSFLQCLRRIRVHNTDRLHPSNKPDCGVGGPYLFPDYGFQSR